VSRSYLVVLGEGEAIAWVLQKQRMAFPASSRAEVRALGAGDRLYLYTTRHAWHNPRRDRGRIIGIAQATEGAKSFTQPVRVAGRSFGAGCRLIIDGLAPFPSGIELEPLVPHLETFHSVRNWGIHLRRPLVSLADSDADLIEPLLRPLLSAREKALATYTAAVTRTSIS